MSRGRPSVPIEQYAGQHPDEAVTCEPLQPCGPIRTVSVEVVSPVT